MLRRRGGVGACWWTIGWLVRARPAILRGVLRGAVRWHMRSSAMLVGGQGRSVLRGDRLARLGSTILVRRRRGRDRHGSLRAARRGGPSCVRWHGRNESDVRTDGLCRSLEAARRLLRDRLDLVRGLFSPALRLLRENGPPWQAEGNRRLRAGQGGHGVCARPGNGSSFGRKRELPSTFFRVGWVRIGELAGFCRAKPAVRCKKREPWFG